MKNLLIILILSFFIAGCSTDTVNEGNQSQPKSEPAKEVVANKSVSNGLPNNNTSSMVNHSVQTMTSNITLTNGQKITSSETGVSYTVQSPAPEVTKSKANKGNKVGN